MDQVPIWGPSSSSTLVTVGGSSLWPQKRWERTDRTGDGPPMGMKLAVGQRDGYAVVGVVGVGWEHWEVGWVVGGHVELRAAQGPAGPAGRRGGRAAGRPAAGLKVRPSVRIDGPAGPQAGRAQQQQVWKSVRPAELERTAAGRPCHVLPAQPVLPTRLPLPTRHGHCALRFRPTVSRPCRRAPRDGACCRSPLPPPQARGEACRPQAARQALLALNQIGPEPTVAQSESADLDQSTAAGCSQAHPLNPSQPGPSEPVLLMSAGSLDVKLDKVE
jgi:hypothetical protein